MSDNNNGPLKDRGKGLEDEWIRRKEAEERAAQKRGSAKPGDKPAPKSDQPRQRKTSSPVSLVLFVIVVAAIIAAFAFLG